MWQQVLWIGTAGAAGTLCRFGMSRLVERLCGPAFPWNTVAVNTLGCLLFGIVWTMSAELGRIDPRTRTIILIGFLGAFTTFSTYAFESVLLARGSQWPLAVGNLLLQNVLGLAAAVAGVALARQIT